MEKPHEMVVIGCFELVLDDDEVIAITGKYVYSPAVGEFVFDSDQFQVDIDGVANLVEVVR